MTYFDVALKVARNRVLRRSAKTVVKYGRNMLRNNATMAERNNTPPTKGGVALRVARPFDGRCMLLVVRRRIGVEHLFDTYSYREV